MNYNLQQALGLESSEIFSPSTIVLEPTEVSSELEMVNEVQELEQASEVVMQASADIDTVEDSIATLESIATTLQVSLENYNVSNTTYAMAYISLEHIEKQFGVESGVLTVGLEDGGEENIEQANTGMLSKVKGMLGKLKDGAGNLIDKIAEGIEIARKNTGKIAARVKSRISNIKNNLKSDNQGGIDLKSKSLNKLSGISENGVVTGASFNKKLEDTVRITDNITNATLKYDILNSYVETLDSSNEKAFESTQKILSEYSKSMQSLNLTQSGEKKGMEILLSQQLISGHRVCVKQMNPKELDILYDEFTVLAKQLDKKEIENVISAENVDSETYGEVVTESEIEKSFKDKIKTTYENINKRLESAGFDTNNVWSLLKWCVLTKLINTPFVATALKALITPFPLIGMFVTLFMLGLTVVGVIKIVRRLWRLGKDGVKTVSKAIDGRREKEPNESLEGYNVSMESNVDARQIMDVLKVASMEISLVKDKDSEKVTVKSMSTKEIEAACSSLDRVADRMIEFVSKTKDRKALLKKYRKTIKKLDVVDGDNSTHYGSYVHRFVKKHLAFEADYCKTLCDVLIAGVTYIEASNNSAPKTEES